jgi:5-methylcytosine-specific restriction endonuclease McrA
MKIILNYEKNIILTMTILNIGKCNHCDKEGKINEKNLCQSCRKSLKRNPDHICRHKKPEKKCIECGGEYHAKNLCKLCYSRSPIRNTPERKAKDKARQKLKKDEYNRNRGIKRNPDYQPRPDRSDFVCECGSTEHNVGGYCKKCAHRKLGYGQKYEKLHEKERKISRLNNPQWQETARENYSKKMCEKLGMTALEIQMKWRKTKNICLIRDDFTCQVCGYTKYLQVHHIYPKAEYYGLFFDIGTLITLCKKCHDVITYKKFDNK